MPDQLLNLVFFCLKQCGTDDSDEIDYGDLFEVKNGASTKFDCESGTICCVPPTKTIPDIEPVVEENETKCEDIPDHSCITEEVRSFRENQITFLYSYFNFLIAMLSNYRNSSFNTRTTF